MSERFSYDDPRLKEYGRNKGGRYLHKIRGGEFREDMLNHGFCGADVTRPAQPDDYLREVCGECKERQDVAGWSIEDRIRFERVSTLTDISMAIHALKQGLRTLPGARYRREHEATATLQSILNDLQTLHDELRNPEA